MTSINWDSLEAIPGTRAPETAHIYSCEQPWRECPVCLSWLEELAGAVRDGRVELDTETTQPVLDRWTE